MNHLYPLPGVLGDDRMLVLGFVPVPGRPGDHIALCDRGNGTFATFQVFANQPTVAYNGHYDMPYDRALYDLATRAKLTTTAPPINLSLTDAQHETIRRLGTDALHTTSVRVDDWDTDQIYEGYWSYLNTHRYTLANGHTCTLVVDSAQVLGLWVAQDGKVYESKDFDAYTEARGEEFTDLDDGVPPSWLDYTDYHHVQNLNLTGETNGPTMLYWYPAAWIETREQAISAAAHLDGMPLCIVEVSGTYGLALTGGGQDFTVSIIRAYLALGQLPPLTFVSALHSGNSLPSMPAGDEATMIIAACLRSLATAQRAAVTALDDLTAKANTWIRSLNR